MDGPRDRAERGFTLIAGAIVAASLVVYWGMPETPRYQLAASDNAVIRLDNDSGEMVSCNAQRCTRIMAPDRAKTIGVIGIERQEPQKQLPAQQQNQQ